MKLERISELPTRMLIEAAIIVGVILFTISWFACPAKAYGDVIEFTDNHVTEQAEGETKETIDNGEWTLENDLLWFEQAMLNDQINQIENTINEKLWREEQERLQAAAAKAQHAKGNGVFTKEMGVYYDGTYKYTYYSSKVLYHNRTCEWHLDDQLFWRDKDGYFVVAADFVDKTCEPVIQTDLGPAKVYDCGTGSNNIIDFYTSW